MTPCHILGIALSLFALGAAAGCAKRNQDQAKATAAFTPQRPDTAAARPTPFSRPGSSLTAELQQGDEPNRYSVRLSWSVEDRVPSTFLQRNGGAKGLVRVETASGPRGQHIDSELEPGSTYEYLLCAAASGGTEVLRRQTLSIPRDLVVAKYEDFAQGKNVEINRLFLVGDDLIDWGGRILRIAAKELISTNAALESFPPDRRAGAGTRGADGGELYISVQRARGRLRVFSRGESGGDGLDGADGQNGAPGAPGRSGEWSTHPEWQKYSTSSAQYYVDTSNRYHLNREFDFWWNQKLSGNQPAFVCKTPPTDGAPGAVGGQGADGGAGGGGGNTGRVFITTTEPSDFDVEVVEEPGTGGIGGRGGKGGGGGPGGPPGAIDAGRRCPPAKQGPVGPAGRDGRQGVSGERGAKAPVCIKNGNNYRGDCGKFATS